MTERDSNLPLLLAAALAAALHLLLVPMGAERLRTWGPSTSADPSVPTQLDPLLPRPEKIRLGADTPRQSSVAWISYEDFRKLMTEQSDVEQPALQQEVEPVEQAPLEDDPTPALAAAPAPMLPTPSPTPSPQPDSSPAGRDVPVAGDLIPLTPAMLTEQAQPGDSPQPDPPPLAPRPAPTQTSSSPPAPPVPPAPALPVTEVPAAKPTSTPRSDRESTPAATEPTPPHVQPGAVFVGQGLEIKTSRPRFDPVTQVSVVPRNPLVRVAFDKQGQVIEARILHSSGYKDVDGPILASLYRWRASGEKLQQIEDRLEIEIHIILVRK